MNLQRPAIALGTALSAYAPVVAFAQESTGATGYEPLIATGYYLSSLGFLVATIMMYLAIRQFGSSSLGSIFRYFLVGTGTFFIITLFQGLGGDFFGINDDSMDVWWHVMFYAAFLSYFLGLRGLVNLGTAAPSSGNKGFGMDKIWAFGIAILLLVVFIVPPILDPLVVAYSASPLAMLGLHHFLAFLLAATVGSYLLAVRKSMGQIGRALAEPMLITIAAFAAQHFWELLFESWLVVEVTSEVGEGIEKIFLVIAAISVTYAAWRLREFSRQ